MASPELQIAQLFDAVVAEIERQIPRPSHPAAEDSDAYCRGVDHGFRSGFLFADEIIYAARQLAVVTGADAVAEFLAFAAQAADDLARKHPRDAVVFADDEASS